MLTREQLLNGKSFLPYETMTIEELGGEVGIQGMTAGDAVEFYRLVKDLKGGMDAEALSKMIVRCLVDENKERILQDDDWGEIMKWPHGVLQRVGLAVMRVNGSAKGN